jgi:hypothetical protein
VADRPLYPVNRAHLDAMTGPFGIWQHARGRVPDPAHGTCTDDVSRALLVDLAHAEELGWRRVQASAWRSLRCLTEAFQPAQHRFRNFRDANGAWDETTPSQDSQGRALLALGTAAAIDVDPAFRDRASRLFAAGLEVAGQLVAIRAVASVALGCAAALGNARSGGTPRAETEAMLAALAARLRDALAPADGLDPAWPWPEPILTYETSLPPRAMVAAGRRLDDPRLVADGLRVLDWLIAVQQAPSGAFSPVGNRGWWPRAGTRSRFDQQPIEAATMILACEDAWSASGDPRYLAAAERAYGWFLGDNDTHVPVAIPSCGACHDGLEPAGVNANRGAESTLAWLMALERMRVVRRLARAAARPAAAQNAAPAAAIVGGR